MALLHNANCLGIVIFEWALTLVAQRRRYICYRFAVSRFLIRRYRERGRPSGRELQFPPVEGSKAAIHPIVLGRLPRDSQRHRGVETCPPNSATTLSLQYACSGTCPIPLCNASALKMLPLTKPGIAKIKKPAPQTSLASPCAGAKKPSVVFTAPHARCARNRAGNHVSQEPIPPEFLSLPTMGSTISSAISLSQTVVVSSCVSMSHFICILCTAQRQ